MYIAQTQISFECAHRLYHVNTYSSECRDNVHGHSYKVTIKVGRNELNDAGMVMDFKLLKTIIKEVIEDKYDHACVIRKVDPLAEHILRECKKVILVDENPTAEWMAKTFHETISKALAEEDTELQVLSVAVQETENNIAIYSLNNN